MVRREIGKAAVELFLRQGFQQTTVDEIAGAANVSRRTFFRYFGTKEEALSAWVDDVGSDLAEALDARPRDEPAFTSLRAALEPLIVYAEQDIERIRMLKALAGPQGLFPALSEAKQGSWASELSAILADRARPEDAAEAALQVAIAFSAYDWAMSQWLRSSPAMSLREVLDRALEQIRRGFGS